jgi:hypothetical protein
MPVLGFRSFVRRWPLRVAVLAGVTAIGMLLCVAAPAAADQITGKRVALVIGNSKYKNVSALPNPGNDAQLVARSLKAAGFTLIGGGAQLDLDKTKFDDLVAKFGQGIADAEVALFYYSGHGLQVGGTNYLVPVSANPTRVQDLDFQMVSADVVLHQMSGAGTKLNIVILDACRNNPFGGRGLRATGGGLAQMQAPEGTLISYATQPGNVASDGDGRDSPFTLALADSLRQPGLDLLRMFNRIGVQVKKTTKGEQQPWVSSSPLEGDFYFTPAQGGAAGTLQAPPPVAAPIPVPAPEASNDPPPQDTQVAANDPPPQPATTETVLAAMRPLDRGFHCPHEGLVSIENGARREWGGPDFENVHVCASRVNGTPERKLFQFYDMNAAGVLLADDALTPFFNGAVNEVTVHIGLISYDWSRAGQETIDIGGKQFQTEKLVVEVDASGSGSNHRGEWQLWYDRQTGLYLKSDYRSYVGSTAAEPPAWQVTAILLKGQAQSAARTADPAPAHVTQVATSAPAVVPRARPLAAPEGQQASARPTGKGGFHCPPRGTTASMDGHYVEWQGVAPGSSHMCVSKIEGRLDNKLFGFFPPGAGDARSIDDALSGFFLGTAEDATVVVNGQRYTWHHAGKSQVSNHGETVDVAVLRVDTQEDGSTLGGHHRGSWTILYDARDGLLLKGSYTNEIGDRRLEQADWQLTAFDPGS